MNSVQNEFGMAASITKENREFLKRSHFPWIAFLVIEKTLDTNIARAVWTSYCTESHPKTRNSQTCGKLFEIWNFECKFASCTVANL